MATVTGLTAERMLALVAEIEANGASQDVINLAAANSYSDSISNGKNTVFFEVLPPTGGAYVDGDVWFDTFDDNRMYRRVGAAWVATQFGTNAIADLSVDATKIAEGTITTTQLAANAVAAGNIAANAVDSTKLAAAITTAISNAQTTATTGVNNAADADAKAVTAIANAATAQIQANTATTDASLADGKAVTAIANAATAQTQASAAVTDAATAVAAAATATTDAAAATTAAAAADAKAVTASGLASTKAVVLYQTVAPGSTFQNQNTLWVDTTGSANTPKRWDGYAWVVITDKAATDAATVAAAANAAAGTAQTQANTATTNAATAQTQANTATTNAATADAKAVTATTNAAAADAKAVTATANAATAQAQANTATDNAATADAKAVTATANAATAQTQANTATTNAAAADAKAVTATNDAATATNNAATAQTKADTAATDAASAIAAAATATTNATAAATAAATADAKAVTASGLASTKAVVLYQTVAPGSTYQNSNTLWIDTTSSANTPKRWDGNAWVAITDKAATDAASAAASANAAAGTAQSQASTAIANAATADAKAVTATTNAATAQTQANTATTNAAAAQTQANTATTNAATATANAATAQTAANNAQTAANNAQTAANTAQTTADGKNKIIFSASAASGTAYAAGDVWFQKSGALIVGQWEFVAGAWAIRTIDSAVIANLNAAKIVAGTITAAQIAADTITSAQIAASAITASELAAFAVVAGKIAAGTIVAADIAANTITAGKIAAGTITTAEIAANTITAADIAAGTITTTEILAGTIVASDIAADTITSAQIAASAITASELAAFSVVAGKLAANSVVAGNIVAGTIVAADIAADTITSAKIAASAITADELAAFSVVAGKLAVDSVVAGNIAADSITAEKIQAGAVTAEALSAAAIDGKVITGATIRTAATGGRFEVDIFGARLYDNLGNLDVNLPTDPNASAFFSGDILATGMTIQDLLSLQGANNEFAAQSVTTLQSGVMPPTGAPAVSLGFPELPLATANPGTWNAYTGLWVPASGGFSRGWRHSTWTWGGDNSTKLAIEHFDAAGNLLSTTAELETWGDNVLGVAESASNYAVLTDGYQANNYWMANYNKSTLAQGSGGYIDLPVGSYKPTIFADASWLYLAYLNATQVVIQRRSPDTFDVLGTYLGPNGGLKRDLTSGIGRAPFDFGSDRFILTTDVVGAWGYTFSISGSVLTLEQTNDSWPLPKSEVPYGIAWDGTRFWAGPRDRGDALVKLSTINWSGAATATWWAGYTWYHTVNGWQSKISPLAKFTMAKRAWVTLSAGAFPIVTSPGVPPDSVMTYMGNGATAPGQTQQYHPAGTPPTAGQRTYVYGSYSFSGANPPSAGTFPGLVAGLLRSAAVQPDGVTPVWSLSGDGTVVASKTMQRGSFATVAHAASTGATSGSVVFPKGPMSSPPAVVLTAATSRLTCAVSGITTLGFNWSINNWTPGATGVSSANWVAIAAW